MVLATARALATAIALSLAATACIFTIEGGEAPATYVAVEGVTVDICDACAEAAEEAGVDLRDAVKEALEEIIPHLPRLSAEVTFVRAPESLEDAGLRAFARAGSGEVLVRMPLDRDSIRILQRLLGPLLAHELHHTQRIRVGPGNATSLLEAIVLEGLADAFALEVYPGTRGWVKWLPTDRERRLFERAAEADLRPYSRRLAREWFRTDVAFPDGYLLGFAIARGYLDRHPDESAASLAGTPYEEIVAGAGLGELDPGARPGVPAPPGPPGISKGLGNVLLAYGA